MVFKGYRPILKAFSPKLKGNNLKAALVGGLSLGFGLNMIIALVDITPGKQILFDDDFLPRKVEFEKKNKKKRKRKKEKRKGNFSVFCHTTISIISTKLKQKVLD